MSRQSKSRRVALLAAKITAIHKEGGRGPKSTTPMHGKDSRKRWCHDRQEWYRRNEPGVQSRFRGM